MGRLVNRTVFWKITLKSFSFNGRKAKEYYGVHRKRNYTSSLCHFYVITIRSPVWQGQPPFIDWSAVRPMVFCKVQKLIRSSRPITIETNPNWIYSLIIQSTKVCLPNQSCMIKSPSLGYDRGRIPHNSCLYQHKTALWPRIVAYLISKSNCSKSNNAVICD